MKAIVKMDSKGRIAIPKNIREEVGLEPGNLVAVYLKNGKITIEPLESTADEYFGVCKVEKWPENLDEFIMEALRKWWTSQNM
ncbi:MAG: AbrB/MazE/SpoVT family DNA-binding domain-containing protein [Thermoprotei archaeon]|nr:MAG: AbrB/MazE/SpoVT family DNA-binding domain-containing protein [Thermoprotei archaeon]